MDEQFPKSALDKFRQWHFWWLVVFSFLLLVTFVYYLPTRFLQQAGTAHDEPMGMPVDESQPHGHDSSGNSIPDTVVDESEPHGHDGGTTDHGDGMMMTDEEMHAHMDEHMSEGMDVDAMTEHMMEMHDMTEEEANRMMDEMMGHDHESTGTATDDHSIAASYFEEGNVRQGLVVNLNIRPVPYNAGVPLSMDFFVNQKPGNIPVLANQLELEHTKLMHVVGLRSDMNEFFHIHPDFLADNPAVFSIDYTFKKPGSYKIWSSIVKDGAGYIFGHPAVNINGSGPKEEKKVSFDRNVITGNYQVSLVSSDTIVKGREVDITFDIHSLNGQEINVENYLGAQMHLVLIKDDWSQFIHTHPGGAGHEHSQGNNLVEVALADEGHGHPSTDLGQAGGDEVIAFKATFPEAGLYKAFAQFRPQGINLPADEALTAEFWIQVEEKESFPISQWWGLLLVSIILMAGLSWLVNNYLKVKSEDIKVKK